MRFREKKHLNVFRLFFFIATATMQLLVSHTAYAQTREQNAQKNIERLLHAPDALNQTDPEFAQIRNTLIFNDIPSITKIDEKTRFLIQITTLTVNQSFNTLSRYVEAALNAGVLPNYIQEAIYQTAPYIGLDKTEAAILNINPIIQKHIYHLPLLSQKKTNDQNRLLKGTEKQSEIFGKVTKEINQNIPTDSKNRIVDLLSSYCFGDFYTRGVLSLKTRELLTFTILVAMNDTSTQLKNHIQGNYHLGNTQEQLTDVLIIMLPHIGFPSVFNALSILNNSKKNKG